MNLYLLKYNNYYNRIVKKFDTLQEYLILPYYNNDVIENVNFNPNDDVDTVQIVNTSGKFDYCILSADGIAITSRWFIIESKRERNGQYRLILRRDLVADNYQSIINAPCFIEKATVQQSDPAIFNNENMGFNQIKTSEVLLKDKTNARWMVGFFARNTTMDEERTVTVNPPAVYDTLDNFKKLYNNAKDVNGDVWNYCSIHYNIQVSFFREIGALLTVGTNVIGFDRRVFSITPSLHGKENAIRESLDYYRDISVPIWDNIASQYLKINDAFFIWNYNKKILQGDNNTYYMVNIITQRYEGNNNDVTSGTLYTSMSSETANNPYISGSPDKKSFSCSIKGFRILYTLTQVFGESVNYKIAGNRQLVDAPYAMFAIPYDAVTINVNNIDYKISEGRAQETALAVSQDLITKFGGDNGNLYDIQLLGYFPMQDYLDEEGKIILTSTTSYTPIKNSSGNPVTFMIWADRSKFHFTMPYKLNVLDYKVSNECDVYRLSSGDYSSSFQFSAAKNAGITYFDFDCYYKPYSSYIHCNPDFKRLYGYDDNSSRGLVVTGDSSITQISNAYETYKRQNINFENIFKREIEHLEFNNKISNIQTLTGAGASALGAGVAAGAVLGPIAGLGAGIASAIGGLADYGMQKALQNEVLDYKNDMFGYQLGNIKALPNTLTRVSTLTGNNKIWVVLEYYTCTDEEKQALKDKIKYNGMTVMRIGKMIDYLQQDYSYIKGRLIRLEDIVDDTNYLNQIAEEINKGVFIK